jgi:hypothetical protein
MQVLKWTGGLGYTVDTMSPLEQFTSQSQKQRNGKETLTLLQP